MAPILDLRWLPFLGRTLFRAAPSAVPKQCHHHRDEAENTNSTRKGRRLLHAPVTFFMLQSLTWLIVAGIFSSELSNSSPNSSHGRTATC